MNLLRKLSDEGNQIITIAPVDEYVGFTKSIPGLKHIPLKHLSRKSTNPLKEILLMLELRAIYKRLNPDIVIHFTHKPNLFGGLAAKLTGTKSIAVLTGLGYTFIHKGFLNSLIRILYKLVAPAHIKFIFENEDDRELFVRTGITNEAKAISVKGCGVDLDYYGQAHAELTKNQKTAFTFIGRLLYDKGIVEFVEAGKQLVKDHSNIELHIVGEFDAGNPSMIPREKLLEWISQAFIKYHGFVEDIRPIIAKSDCVVLPSYREGMPRVMLEAMAMAKPIITTDVPGCRETVPEGKNGFLVDVQDSKSLANAMTSFINMGDTERHLMGDEGRKLVKEMFNSEKISSELYEIISQAYFCDK